MIQIKCNGDEIEQLFGENFVKRVIQEHEEPFFVDLNGNTCAVRGLRTSLSMINGAEIEMDLVIYKRYNGNGMETNESEIRK